MTKRQAARPLIPGSVLSRMKKLFSQKLQTNYGAQPAFYPVGNWLLPGTNSRSVESTSYCNMMPRLRTGGGVPTWCRAELSREGTLLSRIEGKNCDWKVRKAEKMKKQICNITRATTGVGLSILFLVDRLQCIPTLTWQCVSRLFLINVVFTCVCN